MKRITASWLLFAAAACGSPLDTEPTAPPDALGAAAYGKTASLVVEKISGDCTSGITVRVTGQNLSPKSRFMYASLSKSDYTAFPRAELALGTGAKKSVEWTTFWPAELINPSSGAKFSGNASAWVTDAWTGFLHEINATIAPAC